jgi:PAS domain S-box-containing protein
MTNSFPYLKAYSKFLLQFHIDALVTDIVEKAKQADLPILKLLAAYSDEEIFQMAKKGFAEDILIPISQDIAFDKHKQGIEKWKANAVIIPREQLQIIDITSIHNIRKHSMLDFIKYYNCSREDLIPLVKDIEFFFETCIDMGLKAFEQIQKAALTEKSEMLEGILSNIPVIVTKLDKEGITRFSAGAGLKSLGLKDNELLGVNVFRDYPNAVNTRKALQGNTISFIGKANTTSGKVREFQNFFIPEKDGALGFSIDITEQREAEARFRYLVEGVKDYAIFMLTPDGTIASWNEGARILKGYTKDEIVGKHFSIFYPKEKREAHYPEYELEQAIKIGRFEDEGFRIRKDGSMFWANVVLTAIFNEGHELTGFTKITRDLTEKKQVEEVLRRSEERYRLLIDAVKDYSIFMVSPEGKINSWNEGAKRLKGYSEEEALGKHISIFYPQDKIDAKYPDYELEQAKKYGRFEDEGPRIRKDGSMFYANVIITALYDANKKHIGFSKITRDLTERRRNEQNLHNLNMELEGKVQRRTEELSNSIRELKRINNDLDNFIYTASHDLKAPVSNIEGLIYGLYDELGEQAESDSNLKFYKEMITDSIKRFQVTIGELTEIAKIQKGNHEDIEEVDLAALLEDVEISIADLIIKNQAKIISDLNECKSIRFVRKNLKSIFYNLVSNGIKYKSPERKPVIKIKYSSDEDYHIISYQDNGLGIKAENTDKIFTMFKRFHDHVEGTGVGLYIVKRIIENAGGKIEVETTEGEGSTFKVYLPKKPV